MTHSTCPRCGARVITLTLRRTGQPVVCEAYPLPYIDKEGVERQGYIPHAELCKRKKEGASGQAATA